MNGPHGVTALGLAGGPQPEERYGTLSQTLPHGVIRCSADGTIIGADPAAADLLGLPAQEMTTWPVGWAWSAVDQEGSPFRQDELPVMRALRTREIVSGVVIGLPHRRTGELRWLRVTAVPDTLDEQGLPQSAHAIFTDITGQHRAEVALRSNRLLGRLQSANVLGVAVASEEGVHEVNDAFLDIIGYTRDDIRSWPFSWRAITPLEWAAGDDAAVSQLRRTGACQPYEKEYVHKDGHRVPILIGAAVLDWHPLRWTTFVVDLSARQRREQERAALVAREQAARKEADIARERLGFLLQAGALADATPDRADLLGQVSDLAELAAARDENRGPGAGDESEARRAQAALSSLNAELEERVSRRTSELVRAEADRGALAAELEHAERLQTAGQLASGIAHDFGNLLSVIVGYAEMAEDVSTDRDPELHRILEEIHGAADRAARLTGDLLRFSGQTRAKREEIDLNTLVTGIRDLLSASMNGRAEVRIEPPPTALPAVLADRGRLEQVLLNLAVNARDAMRDGGTLTISTRPAPSGAQRSRPHPGTSPGRYVELAVQDTGTGMSAGVRARIFQRYFTTKPAGKGTGLGLFTVHGIIADLGGTIDVDSREGRGTTFRIFLPAIPGPREAGG